MYYMVAHNFLSLQNSLFCLCKSTEMNEPHTFNRKSVFCQHKILTFLKIITVSYNYFATNRQGPVCSMNWIFRRFRKIFKRRLLISSCLSVRLSEWKSSAPIGRIFMKFDILIFFGNLSRKFKFQKKSEKNKGYFIWSKCIFLITSHSFLPRTKSVLDKSCRENKNTHFMFNHFFRKQCRLWDNVEKYFRSGKATEDNMAHAPCMLNT